MVSIFAFSFPDNCSCQLPTPQIKFNRERQGSEDKTLPRKDKTKWQCQTFISEDLYYFPLSIVSPCAKATLMWKGLINSHGKCAFDGTLSSTQHQQSTASSHKQ